MDPPVRLLIHLPNWIGDAVVSLPSVEAAARWDGCRLTLLGREDPLSLTEHIPGIVERMLLPPRPRGLRGLAWFYSVARSTGRRYDAALTLSPSFSSAALLAATGARLRVGWVGEGRSLLLGGRWKRKRRGRIHLVREYEDLVRSLGIQPGEAAPAIRWGDGELDEGRKLLDSLGGREAVAVAPGAAYGPAKRWPLDRFRALANGLVRRGLGVVWIGGAGERGVLSEWLKELEEPSSHLDVMGVLSLRQSASVLAHCQVAVANDSGAMHLAQAAGCATVALFGSTEPSWTGPLGQAKIVTNPVFCSPCFLSSCPRGLECWKGIEVERVLEAVDDLLGVSGGHRT